MTASDKKRESALLIFWRQHSQPAFAGLLTGDGFTWDSSEQAYRSESGSWIRQDEQKAIVLAFLLSCELMMESDAQYVADSDYAEGQYAEKVSDEKAFEAWRKQQEETITNEFLIVAALAAGGLDELTDEDFTAIQGAITTEEKIGSGIKDAMVRLRQFTDELLEGDAGSLKQITNRAGQYSDGAWGVYQNVRQNSHERATDEQGRKLFLFEKNQLDDGVMNHCHTTDYAIGCPEVSAEGWQPIGTLPKIGERQCTFNCRCSFAYSLVPPEE